MKAGFRPVWVVCNDACHCGVDYLHFMVSDQGMHNCMHMVYTFFHVTHCYTETKTQSVLSFCDRRCRDLDDKADSRQVALLTTQPNGHLSPASWQQNFAYTRWQAKSQEQTYTERCRLALNEKFLSACWSNNTEPACQNGSCTCDPGSYHSCKVSLLQHRHSTAGSALIIAVQIVIYNG